MTSNRHRVRVFCDNNECDHCHEETISDRRSLSGSVKILVCKRKTNHVHKLLGRIVICKGFSDTGKCE